MEQTLIVLHARSTKTKSQHQNFKKVLRTHLADGDFYSIEEALDNKWVMQPVELLL